MNEQVFPFLPPVLRALILHIPSHPVSPSMGRAVHHLVPFPFVVLRSKQASEQARPPRYATPARSLSHAALCLLLLTPSVPRSWVDIDRGREARPLDSMPSLPYCTVPIDISAAPPSPICCFAFFLSSPALTWLPPVLICLILPASLVAPLHASTMK
ncbi:hypothetical protein BC567DRAFT_77419 [Phyllosticta citribraziliensis]